MLRLGSRVRAHIKRRSVGQSIVEFALILPVFMLFFAAVLDLGRIATAQIAVTNAAREGAFQAAKTPADFNSTLPCPADGLTNKVYCRITLESSGGVTIAPADVKVTCNPVDCSKGIGNTVTVVVDGHFQLFTPFMAAFFGGSQSVVFTASATQQRETLPTSTTSTSTSTSSTSTSSSTTTTTSSTTTTTTSVACTLPSAGFTHVADTAPSGHVSLTVSDTSTSLACGITSWFWNFGDGTTSTVQNPTNGAPHDYRRKGTYIVTLEVTNAAGSNTTGGVQITVN
jgi:hypothetical protein